MSPTDPGARAGRRTRLSRERELELYEAVIELLSDVGYEALTMDAVAARTRSSKATLYRQWRGKPELVATALRETRVGKTSDVDTGTLAGDLREIVRRLGEHAAKDTPIMRALGHAAERNEDLARAMRETLIEPETRELRRMLDRAVDRGELDPDRPATRFLILAMIGPLMGRPLVEDRPVDADFLLAYLEAVVLPALGLEG